MTTNRENLGAAERIIQTLLTYNDHLYHGRPGVVVPDASSTVGVRWIPVTHKEEDGKLVVYELRKVGKKTQRIKIGNRWSDNSVRTDENTTIGQYREAGLFPEVAAWMYRQVAEVWQLDNEFAARWASFEFNSDHRNLKVVLAAFMLVQSRKGDPVRENGEVAFLDEDYRDVGEAMVLIYGKGHQGIRPRDLLQIHDFLTLPVIAEINRELGFGLSARKPFLGRWNKAVEKWLRYREQNPMVLEGLVKSGYKSTVMELARKIGYKPETPKFFETLRWKQAQAKDGRRTIAIGQAVSAAETWEGLSESAICERIVQKRPNIKRIEGMLPSSMGMTRAIMAAAIESGCLSDKDLIIKAPTLEELGLLQVQTIRERWEAALKKAEDTRAANIAARMKSKDNQEALQEAADTAVKKAVEEVVRGLRIYTIVDVSGSMQGAIETAKGYIAKFLQAFPKEQLHVSVFNTQGREVEIKHASAAGVTNAFRGVRAGGGTDYGAGVRVLQKHKPQADEDVLFIFVGDECASDFSAAVQASGLNPMAFGLVPVVDRHFGRGDAVRSTAARLGIPCFEINEQTFADAYAIPRTLRNLVAATPVRRTHAAAAIPRVTLLDQILQTKLLEKPAWAA